MPGGRSWVTTLPAVTTLPLPTVTPGATKTLAQIQTPSSITIGLTIRSNVGFDQLCLPAAGPHPWRRRQAHSPNPPVRIVQIFPFYSLGAYYCSLDSLRNSPVLKGGADTPVCACQFRQTGGANRQTRMSAPPCCRSLAAAAHIKGMV